MESGLNLPKPDKGQCAQCGISESTTVLRRCSKCRRVMYCSVECQKMDWKLHKQRCDLYVVENAMNGTGVFVGEKIKTKKGEIKRTKAQMLRDLTTYAQCHSGDSLTVSAWHLLGLTKRIDRARSHFLAVTVRRTDSDNPRTFYSLVDVQVLPWEVLEASYERAAALDGTNISPRALFENDEARRKREGALGSVMVVSIELPRGENRSAHDALMQKCMHILQPLGLFKVHKQSLSALPPVSTDFYIQCLRNALDGGAYSTRFQPFTPM